MPDKEQDFEEGLKERIRALEAELVQKIEQEFLGGKFVRTSGPLNKISGFIVWPGFAKSSLDARLVKVSDFRAKLRPLVNTNTALLTPVSQLDQTEIAS